MIAGKVALGFSCK